MYSSIFTALFCLIVNVQALHFYLNTGETRCFFEELPADTLVVGRVDAFEHNQHLDTFIKSPNLNVEFTVDVSISGWRLVVLVSIGGNHLLLKCYISAQY